MMTTQRCIRNAKRSRLYCRLVEWDDKRKIRRLVKKQRNMIRVLAKMTDQIPLFVEYGIYSVDGAIETRKHIVDIAMIGLKENPRETFERIDDLSIQRIAERIGGEVVEGGEENAEG